MDTRQMSSTDTANRTRCVLNAGSGPASGQRLHPGFLRGDWREIRLDIEAAVKPDIIASLTDMSSSLADASVDAIWSSHCLEHLHTHEVIPALREFRRVLRPGGFALIVCPDLTAVARFALEHGIEAVAYMSPAGPIRPLDMIYGYAHAVAAGQTHMAHHSGFTAARLGRVALESGFAEVRVQERDPFDLCGALTTPEANFSALADQFRGTDAEQLFVAARKDALEP